MKFEWDLNKAEKNEQKHGVSFDEAVTIFDDNRSLTVRDVKHSKIEERFFIVGATDTGRIILVCHTERGDRIRIISARPASRKERKQYAEQE